MGRHKGQSSTRLWKYQRIQFDHPSRGNILEIVWSFDFGLRVLIIFLFLE